MIFVGCYDEDFDNEIELSIVEQLLIWTCGYIPKFREVCYWYLLDEPLSSKQIEFINSYGFLTEQIAKRSGKHEVTIYYNEVHKHNI